MALEAAAGAKEKVWVSIQNPKLTFREEGTAGAQAGLVTNNMLLSQLYSLFWDYLANIHSMYDSKPSYSLNSSTLRTQVAVIMKTPDKCFEVFHVDIQWQVGSSDYGLLAIALVVTLF